MNCAHRLRHDERGIALVFVGLGFFAFFSVTMLAIDVGMLMTARAQAQNAADAGALAGAIALVYDTSPGGPQAAAVQSAIATARANLVMGAAVSVDPPDVTVFSVPPGGPPNRVKVNVFRTQGRGNPVATVVARLFGHTDVDINATATADVSGANAAGCLKPWTIPDKWIETQTPPWDPDDTFDIVDAKGNPLANPDVYIPTAPGVVGTGFSPQLDKGVRLLLKAAQKQNIAPSFYFAWAMPGSTGGADYRWNIAHCNPAVVHINDPLTAEPGNMVGPTAQGVQQLIAQDPNAYWDSARNRVVSTHHPSPRIIIVPTFDPVYYEMGKHNGRNASLKCTNLLGFFIEQMVGNSVYGRITPITGIVDRNAPTLPGAFPKALRLVE